MCVQSFTTFGVCFAPQKRDSFGGRIIIIFANTIGSSHTVCARALIKAASSDDRALAATHVTRGSSQLALEFKNQHYDLLALACVSISIC